MINKILKEIKKQLEKQLKNNFTGLVLYGSYAKNKQTPKSDIDILITFKHLPPTQTRRYKLVENIIDPLEDKYKVQINPIIKEEEKITKSYLMCDIAEYGKIIEDKNKKIKKFFQSIKNDYKKGFIKKIIKSDYYVLQIQNA